VDVNDRLARLEALNALGDVLNAAPTFAEAAPRALARLVPRVGVRAGWLFLTSVAEGDAHQGTFHLAAAHGLPPALEHHNRSPLCDGSCECQRLFRQGQLDRGINMVTCSRLRDAVGERQGLVIHASVPLLGSRGPVGILNLAAPGHERFDGETLAFLSAVGKQLAVAFERSRLLEERTDEARYAATLEERQRLAHEMHDSLAQLLFAADLALGVAAAGPDAARDQAVRDASGIVRDALEELRALVEVLRPADLSAGLHAALVRLAQRSGGSLDVHLEAAPVEPPPAVADALYRVAQEAVHNALRHAGGTHLWIRLELRGGHVVLSVADNGRGFGDEPDTHVGRGFGLSGMRERATALGGTLRLDARPGGGARLCVEVPWQPGY